MIPDIKIKPLHPNFRMPEKKTAGAACWDIYLPETVTVYNYKLNYISLGFAIEPPKGYAVELLLRSGLSKEYRNYIIPHGMGIIDTDYRGEVILKLMYINTSDIGYRITRVRTAWFEEGLRVCQFKLTKTIKADLTQTDKLSNTERGEGGFGSTGE